MTAKSINKLFQMIETTIKADASVLSILDDAGFQTDPAVNVVFGYDPEYPPELSEIPTVYLNTGGRGRSADFRMRTFVLTVWPTIQTDRRADNLSLTSVQSLDLIDQLCNAIDTALLQALQVNNYVALPQVSDEPDQLIYPAVRAYLGYEIQIPANLPATP